LGVSLVFSVSPTDFRDVACRGAQLALAVIVLSASSCKKAPDAALPEIITTKSGIEMVQIPAGHFKMGTDKGKDDEVPAHEVQIDAFLMDRYEMTQAAFAKLEPLNGSHFKGPDRPVEMISWGDAALLCNKRSLEEGLEPCYDAQTGDCNYKANGYRLPTEAEWEYACRAGTTTDYHFGSDPGQLSQSGWFADNSSKQTQPVGRKKPNAWGLYDMHGNVAEWCNDVYDKTYYQNAPANNPHGPDDGPKRVLRGGAWNSKPGACRAAYRVGESPGSQDACFARDAIGFRCVRRVPQSPPAK